MKELFLSPRKAYPSDLTDAQWKILEPLVPTPKKGAPLI